MSTPNESFNTSLSDKEYDSATETHSRVIPVIEEELNIRKEIVETGSVTLTKHVDIETVNLDLERVDNLINVERRQVNELLDQLPEAVYQEDDKTIYRLIREVPVIVKKFEVYEEIVVSRSTKTSTESVQVDLRKERISVEKDSLES